MSLEPSKRRRGTELEHAILDAAWEVLVDGGYGAFTVEAVAERAQTSRHVLYRRWATRGDLVLAAIRRQSDRTAPALPDTGSLRGDLLALMTNSNGDRMRMAAVLSVHFGTYYRETGTTPADLRNSLVGDYEGYLDTIFGRAAERGEIPAGGVSARVMNLAGDLLRHEVLMTFAPVPDSTIVEIVDDVVLPLVRKT
ncbi:TetR/AcrR family transcriptional regulator [Umezawaea endophytica]|uniref:TetR/AcrR family transcriptional regulator n=1 Tax=Umezawaea endophytica TaxID=1654476 RepID=A0A9X2VH79_9PSEU|nr:TetR/AcrR family transcriptional regulator [Umezawaea endophytica]MCS7476359.1 TetR/AcrR family transcriptional regulator [Umezawaea endophytica]